MGGGGGFGRARKRSALGLDNCRQFPMQYTHPRGMRYRDVTDRKLVVFCEQSVGFREQVPGFSHQLGGFFNQGVLTTPRDARVSGSMIPPCKGKRQYLFALQASRYCILPLQSRFILMMPNLSDQKFMLFVTSKSLHISVFQDLRHFIFNNGCTGANKAPSERLTRFPIL